MTELEKLIKEYQNLTDEEIHKVLIFVETLKTQHTQEFSVSLQEKE